MLMTVMQTPRALTAFGVPFVMAVSPTETMADVADRIQKRLCIPNEQCAAWRFKCASVYACTLTCLSVNAASCFCKQLSSVGQLLEAPSCNTGSCQT
jgi:Ubiquitin-specific protease C-terminal